MEPSAPSDEELISRFQNGEATAFDALFHRYRRRVFSWCYLMVRDAETASDFCQESFVRIYHGLARFESRSSFATWARKVAFNTCVHLLERERRNRHAAVESAPPARSLRERPDEALERAEEEHLLQQVIHGLPPVYRAVFLLREVEGLAYDDIGEALGLSLSQVKSHLFRARRIAMKRYLSLISDGDE